MFLAPALVYSIIRSEVLDQREFHGLLFIRQTFLLHSHILAEI